MYLVSCYLILIQGNGTEKSDEEGDIDFVMAEADLVRESTNRYPRRWRARRRKMKVFFVCVWGGGVVLTSLFVY